MKILKKGETTTPVVKFKCRNCGTIFEADNTEYEKKFDPRDNEFYCACDCPTCNSLCIEYD